MAAVCDGQSWLSASHPWDEETSTEESPPPARHMGMSVGRFFIAN